MEANLEEPIDLDELAVYVNVSRRQLERLFQKYLHCSPSRYYLKLRLIRARQLLKQTSMSIIEVASVCGFVSTRTSPSATASTSASRRATSARASRWASRWC